MAEIKCEKCGMMMVSYKEGLTIGMRCPNCGWGWAATQFDPIDLDQTTYTVKFDAISNPTKEQLKKISEILNVNYLIAAKLLKEGNASFSAEAVEVRNKMKNIMGSNIGFSIYPEFKYEM